MAPKQYASDNRNRDPNVVPRHQRWCLAAAIVLHLNVLVLPIVWAHFSSAPIADTVQVFLVQSNARIPAPALSQASARASRTQPQPETPPLPARDAAASQPASNVQETTEQAQLNTLNAEAGAPPAVLPRFDPAYLNNQAPLYPPSARRLGEQGRVLLRVFVRPDGSAREVLVSSSSGSTRLDAAARKAVERWKFLPARQGDSAVGAWVIVPISFSLEG